jgi:hypothetical protein
VRKKIPTVTRPDPNYAASLNQHSEQVPEKGADVAAALHTPTRDNAARPADAKEAEASSLWGTASPPEDRDPAEMPPQASPGPATARSLSSRKIDIRVNALKRQEAALRACGVDPAHVVRAALRRAIRDWSLSPVFAPPAEDARTRNTRWQARTTLAVDPTAFAGLLRRHDPLDVLSKWALIRGQVEPRVWAAIDAILAEIEQSAASQTVAQVAVNIDLKG